ncbi:Pyr-redox-3 multi-domain protein [Pyrenophora tritici-repentis]|nr:cyclopentanone 1 2-monooxygenase [Pyrenophora tritici-repentis]KAG9387080.1 cyclopentanone 1,2-monooxygenase [Pyrenophora tritici-repentis]KAI1522533.1 Pyr-redox-3 multi-domain protein [Pyrenophora tritici-repentis]KAI1525170.1 Pyr-redox-3 multi-domain protein [Pyrenophora tritici-repentis]KAI1559682.1 Pyr-redox-3 multi-domain protein [Pyrenophora tritici-repentis]
MHLDAVVVGAGFSGIASLYRLRKAGLTVKAFEAGPRLGGVWHWNRYPGARVDGEYPFYQLNIPEVQQGWDWEFKFPDRKELAGYFDHLDKILGLSKDTYFNSEVTSVRYNVVEGQWTVKAGQRTATCKYLILAAGALHRAHRPDFPGLSNFAGQVYHTASWPENIDLYGKRVAVIGTGATGVQVIQELSKQVDYLLVCVRNPSYCLPMVQKRVSEEEKLATKPKLQEILAKCRNDPAGYFSAKKQGKVFDQTLEEREAYWEELWSQGGSHFASSNYSDILTDQAANLEIYNFWAKKTRAQMTDPVKMDIVAPLKPPYPFGAKRCVQAQDYYKCLNQANVEVISIQNSPISEFNRNGFVTEDGTQKNFDVLVLATGFDSFTGSLTTMGLQTKNGIDIQELWKDEVRTYLGVFVPGLPNAFLIYSPQAPTAWANGPTIIECQADIMLSTIQKLELMNAKSIEPKESAEAEWREELERLIEPRLSRHTKSWFNGGNIPGKKVQVLTYNGSFVLYEKTCWEALESWKGFDIVLND